MDTLVHGYREESELYTRVRKLTWRQRETLCEGWDLDRFGDLLDEKEDLLQMIGQIESRDEERQIAGPVEKAAAMPEPLEARTLLDQLTAMIEEIRDVEGANATLLEDALAAG